LCGDLDGWAGEGRKRGGFDCLEICLDKKQRALETSETRC